MFEEFFPFLWAVIILGFSAYVIKKSGEVIKQGRIQSAKVQAVSKNPLSHYGSFYEMLCSMEQGLDMQYQQIAKRCQDEGKDPTKDTGAVTVLQNYNRVKGTREKFESGPWSPVLMMGDQIAFPIIRDLIPDATNLAKRLMRFA